MRESRRDAKEQEQQLFDSLGSAIKLALAAQISVIAPNMLK
jgi:hypothetical protein